MDNKRCEETRPCQHCVDQGRECVNLARKGKGHGTRVKAVSSFTYVGSQVMMLISGINTGMHKLQVSWEF